MCHCNSLYKLISWIKSLLCRERVICAIFIWCEAAYCSVIKSDRLYKSNVYKVLVCLFACFIPSILLRKKQNNKTKDRLNKNYYKSEQDIWGSDDEAKCAIAWLDMRWPKQVNSPVHLEKTPAAHPSRWSLSSLSNSIGFDIALRFIGMLFYSFATWKSIKKLLLW